MLDTDFDTTTDQLEQDVLACELLVTRLRARQAESLRELDRRQVRMVDGARSLQEWVRARLDVSDTTARDLVHAARCLPDRPELQKAAEEGSYAFDRIVATSRLANSGADEDTLERSFGYDISGVARLRHRQRNITALDETDLFSDRRLFIQDTFDGSGGRTVVELPGFEHRILTKALEQRADMFNDLPGPAIAKWQRMADAAVSIAQDSLDGYEPAGSSTRSEPVATVLVDASLAGPTKGEAGAEIAYGHRVGPRTLERILCVGRVQIVGLERGRPVIHSPATRSIPPATRRFVAWRDGSCTISGCNSRYRLQPHHVTPRSDGGSHDPENLTTLCWFHHHVVIHGMGLRIDPESPPQKRLFVRARARAPDLVGG
ncbi:MAG: DUF222 domain-containing protein [Acidimicrobiia bacterium]|nr:DUF222 domain-containing protein [Acidimicrobiia bacterium]